MTDFIIIAVLLLVIVGAAAYVIRQRKRGAKCIGCPYAGSADCSCHK